MSNPNLSAILLPADIITIKSDLLHAKGLLPFLVNLTPQERKEIYKMGPKSLNYVEYALSVATEHPGILSGNFSLTEFEKDFNLTRALNEISIVSGPLLEGISDTQMLAGSEAMYAANIVYSLVKLAAQRDSAFDGIRMEMKRRFENQGNKKNHPLSPNP